MVEIEWVGACGGHRTGNLGCDGLFPHFQNVFGTLSLIVSAGIPAPNLLVTGVVLAVAVARVSAVLDSGDALALLCAGTCLFTYGHDYDLVRAVPVLASLWRWSRTSSLRTLAVTFGYGLLFFPQRFLRGRVPAPLLHSREIVLLVIAVGLLWASRNAWKREGTTEVRRLMV